MAHLRFGALNARNGRARPLAAAILATFVPVIHTIRIIEPEQDMTR